MLSLKGARTQALGLSAARLLSTSANATGYSVIAASDETFEKKVLKEPGLTVVDFYAEYVKKNTCDCAC